MCEPLCGSELCDEGWSCFENRCVSDDAVRCGETICNDDQVCQREACREVGDCGGAACLEGEVCYEDACRPVGDCDGIMCDETTEVCFEGKCHLAGKCGGIACDENEKCYYGECLPVGDCGGIACNDTEYCYAGMCYDKIKCGDVYCERDEMCENEACVPAPICVTGLERCNGVCCEENDFCGKRATCCAAQNACGSDCCRDGEVCEYEACHIQCDEGVSRCRLDDNSEVCCASGEICSSGQCFKPSVSCVDNYMCENGEFCDTTMHTCLPQPEGEVCQAEATGGQVQPTLVWHWGEGDLKPSENEYPNHVRVMSTPMVADVNRDGTPEVIFNAFSPTKTTSLGNYNGNGILRILDGKTGKLLHSSHPVYFDPSVENPGTPDLTNLDPAKWYMTDGGSQVAVGDIIPSRDGLEIATCIRVGDHFKVAVFDNEANMLWYSQEKDASGAYYNECGQSGPGIADFNGDGAPEVFSRYNVFDGATGKLIARTTCAKCRETNYQHVANDYPLAADVDGDGILELVGGNIVYKVNFEAGTLDPLWDKTDERSDGYPAIADLDLDGEPELVVVTPGSHQIMAYRAATGEKYWTAATNINADIDPATMLNDAGRKQEEGGGGPANIGNVDDDPYPEITMAGGFAYVVFEHDGKVKWYRRTHDFSSKKTGSSIFDFDGDGKAEAVYADELFLRVYDGETGDTKFCKCNTSGTHWEYPVVVDVNNDGHAEIVISSNTYSSCATKLTQYTGLDDCVASIQALGGDEVKATNGVRVFSSPNQDWVNTRKIYNQHAYSITNISDDGTIPTNARRNWKTQNLNNFRLNVQPGATYLPDLEIRDISTKRTCASTIPMYFQVVNVGWASAAQGITVNIWGKANADAEYVQMGTATTTQSLRAGEGEHLNVELQNTLNAPEEIEFMLTFGEDVPAQCRDDNDSATYTLICPIN